MQDGWRQPPASIPVRRRSPGFFCGAFIFDENSQSLSGDFENDDRQGRTIQVDTRAIIEALRKIYRADGLAKELMSGREPAVKRAVPGN